MVDFELRRPVAIPLDEVDPGRIRYNFRGYSNVTEQGFSFSPTPLVRVEKSPDVSEYEGKFNRVIERIRYGDSFLTNLTVKTEISISRSLLDIFGRSEASYKLWYNDEFVVFSPEAFVTIANNRICSYPMKGTIDATVAGAREKLLSNAKEMAEHVTIVDLIRNDLSQVATEVEVKRFRYLDRLKTDRNELWQVSSEVAGNLDPAWHESVGNILTALLPAGSVSGAPKPRTLNIIRQVEEEPRGYYTGITGVYDGKGLVSGVMIRFIERDGDRYYYRSGGGITAQSNLMDEFREVQDKVYIPLPLALTEP